MKYTVRKDTENCVFIDWQGREIAFMSSRDDCDDEQFANLLAEGANNYRPMLEAVKRLVFLVGQLPLSATIHDQELRLAYNAASEFIKAEWEKPA